MDSCKSSGQPSGKNTKRDAKGMVLALPMEILVRIMGMLHKVESVSPVGMTCRTLALASSDDQVWRPLGHPSWPSIPRSPSSSAHALNLNTNLLCICADEYYY